MKNTSKPLVSVITPVYNAQKFLKRTATTVLMQDWNVEHIFINDKSTDDSLNILIELQKNNNTIIIVNLDKNSGPIVARNKGISIARGKYIAFLDADDFWTPDKLKVQIEFMEKNNYAATFTDYRHVSEDGNKIGLKIFGPTKIGTHIHHSTRFIGCLTVVINKKIITNFSFTNISPAIRAEDFLAWQSIIDTHQAFIRCPRDLGRYSIVSNSRSSKSIKASMSVWTLYRSIENKSLVIASIYFLSYIFAATIKKIFFKPIMKRQNIDKNCDWSILNIN